MADVLYNNIVEGVSSGIKQAALEHLKLTNNRTELSYAPEYFITVNIVDKLKNLSNSYVILEESMGGEINELPRGRHPEGWKRNKRYDIVVRDKDYLPFAAIEVKNRVYGVSERVIEDFRRISNAVNFRVNETDTFKMGIFAFYTVFDEEKTSPNEKIEIILKLYTDLQKELSLQKGKAHLSRGLIEPTTYSHDWNSIWGGGSFILSNP